MWQQQAQPYFYNQVVETTLNPNPNSSIDLVVTQVEQLAGKINTLTNDGEAAGLKIADRAIQTWNSMSSAFQNATFDNVKNIGNVISEKTSNWPVTELIVMLIIGVVLVVITLIFLFMLCGERITEYRYRKKLSSSSDIENI